MKNRKKKSIFDPEPEKSLTSPRLNMHVFSAEWAPDGPTIRTGESSKILGKKRGGGGNNEPEK